MEFKAKFLAPITPKKNWAIVNEKTGAYWNGEVVGGWTTRDNAHLFSSNELMYSLPRYGKWVNIETES